MIVRETEEQSFSGKPVTLCTKQVSLEWRGWLVDVILIKWFRNGCR
jgi:hypothetical protein